MHGEKTMTKPVSIALLTLILGSAAACNTPAALVPETPATITAEMISATPEAWMNQEVEVTGAYGGRAWSSASGTTVVWLTDPAGNKAVACRLPGQPDGMEKLAHQTGDIVVRGVVQTDAPPVGEVVLGACTLVQKLP